jgi:uncharacterized protein YigE (DUF2233 family)
MKKIVFILLIIATISFIAFNFLNKDYFPGPPKIVSIKVNPDSVNISFYWKSNGKNIKNISKLKTELENQNNNLIFATNGGMFDEKLSPIGLFVENGQLVKPLNTKVFKPEVNTDIPNFYRQPNGVFYITNEENAGICKTTTYPNVLNVKFATQSGPMLVVDGEINKIFDPNSRNFNIRNGVGILPNNELVFAISMNKVSFYDFSRYFKEQGCSNALFLDGYISKAYMPEQEIEQMDGKLGVLIGITEK